MLDFIEIVLFLTAVVVFGFCFYQQGKRDAHSQARMDAFVESTNGFAAAQAKLNCAQGSWNKTMRAQLDAMAALECQRRMLTPDDVWFLYCEMQKIDATQHDPERIAREGN